MSKHRVDLLIVNAHLLSMQGSGVGYIANGAIAVEGSRIVAVDTTESIIKSFQGELQIDATGCVVLPGLINAHVDSSMAIMRGMAQDVTHWFADAALPFFDNMNPAEAMAGTRLRVLEELKAGTTTFCDNRYPDPAWARFFESIGARASLAPLFTALPADLPKLAEGDLYPFDEASGRQAMEDALEFACTWNGAAEGRITTMLGMYSPDTLPKELLRLTKESAKREGLGLHFHISQGAGEIDQIEKRYGMRPIALLEELGFLDDQLLAVHLTEATEDEVIKLARSGAGMALCSGMIALIDGRLPPAHRFRQAGGAVALGGSCNNLFQEMKLTALFNKLGFQDPSVMPAWEVLRMATVEGARAIGLGDKIGSLEVGKEADIIIVELGCPQLSPTVVDPIRNIVPNLVYSASGTEVRTVVVAGQLLVENYQCITADESVILREAREHAQGLSERVARSSGFGDTLMMKSIADGLL